MEPILQCESCQLNNCIHTYIHIDGVVGFEKTVYSVPEDIPGGVVEICAIVYTNNCSIQCSIPFPFILQANIPIIGNYDITSVITWNFYLCIYLQDMISR